MDINNDNRISWDEMFMDIAFTVAKRSTCLRRHVGAVIVKNNQVISSGYNGAPKGLKHCREHGGCIRERLNVPSGQRMELCRATHAEANSLRCDPLLLKGATLYVTTSPCSMCLKQLLNAEIKKIVTIEPYPDDLSKELIEESKIEYVILDNYKIKH